MSIAHPAAELLRCPELAGRTKSNYGVSWSTPILLLPAHIMQSSTNRKSRQPHTWLLAGKYHSIVLRNPTSNGVVASNPNRALARLVSSFRRGCPLGLLVSQAMRPSKLVLCSAEGPVRRAIVSGRFLMLIACMLLEWQNAHSGFGFIHSD